MPSASANGITLEYETAGDPGRPPLLLIMGLGGQLVAWDEGFVATLVDRGFYVIRYDNRDVGRSTWLDEAGAPDLAAAFGGALKPAYLLSDMADDAAALLAALGIDAAHVLGVSMGGMIAQSLVLGHAGRVRALVSVMSTTGDGSVGQPHPEALGALLVPPPADREAAIEVAVKMWQVIGSPGFPFHEDRVRERAALAFDRGFHPAGTARQMVAIMASPDRTSALGNVTAPTLVVHGESDILVDPSGGRATVAAIPGAELWTVPGMGHDLPMELWDQLADRVTELSRRA